MADGTGVADISSASDVRQNSFEWKEDRDRRIAEAEEAARRQKAEAEEAARRQKAEAEEAARRQKAEAEEAARRQKAEAEEAARRQKAEAEEARRSALEAEARAKRLKELKEMPLPPARVSPSKYPKNRYVPRTGIGRFALKDRHRIAVCAAALMMVVAMGYQMYDYLVPKTVLISLTTYEETRTAEYKTRARTAGVLFDELVELGSEARIDMQADTGSGDAQDERAGAMKAAADADTLAGKDIVVGVHDLTDMPEDRPVVNGLEMNIRHASSSKAMVGGIKQEIWLVPGTVEENLVLNGIAYDDDDEISPALDKVVGDKTRIVVDEVHYDVAEKTEEIEAESRVILDPSLTSGVQESTEGNDGKGVFTYTTKVINGKKQETERELKEWITEPHDHVLRLGTAATGNSGEYRVARTFTANTTAYTAGAGARGALGMAVHYGTCAVDPRYVSLRSELWVDGYGYAYAMDTGGAVKGNVVDLYMNSNSACRSWGRRNRTAYVLVPAE